MLNPRTSLLEASGSERPQVDSVDTGQVDHAMANEAGDHSAHSASARPRRNYEEEAKPSEEGFQRLEIWEADDDSDSMKALLFRSTCGPLKSFMRSFPQCCACQGRCEKL